MLLFEGEKTKSGGGSCGSWTSNVRRPRARFAARLMATTGAAVSVLDESLSEFGGDPDEVSRRERFEVDPRVRGPGGVRSSSTDFQASGAGRGLAG